MKNNGENNPVQRSGLTRRATLASLAATGLSLGIGSGVVAAGDSDGGRAVSPAEVQRPYPETETYVVDESVRTATNHYDLLTLDEDTVFSYVERADLSENDRQAARDALVDLRRAYPVERVREGNVVRFAFADDLSTQSVDTDDRAAFRDAKRAFASGATSDSSDDASAQWFTSGHTRQMRTACQQVGVSDGDTDDLALNADEPDRIGCNCDVSFDAPSWVPFQQTVEDAIQSALDGVARYYGQYYDPDGLSFTLAGQTIDLGAVGGAPTAGEYTMSLARDSSGYERRKFLGYSSHYVADMSVPLHTGMGVEQANLVFDCGLTSCGFSLDPMRWLHSGYEEFVYEQWDALKDDFEGGSGTDSDYYYYPIDDTAQAVKDLAGVSSDYSYDIYHRILDEETGNPADWSSATRDSLLEKSANCLNEAGLYYRGYLKEFY